MTICHLCNKEIPDTIDPLFIKCKLKCCDGYEQEVCGVCLDMYKAWKETKIFRLL